MSKKLLENMDWVALARDVTPLVADALRGLAEGAQEDLERFAGAIARDMLVAQLTSDEDLEAQLRDQLRLVAEVNRIRISKKNEAVAWKALRLALKFGGVVLGLAAAAA